MDIQDQGTCDQHGSGRDSQYDPPSSDHESDATSLQHCARPGDDRGRRRRSTYASPSSGDRSSEVDRRSNRRRMVGGEVDIPSSKHAQGKAVDHCSAHHRQYSGEVADQGQDNDRSAQAQVPRQAAKSGDLHQIECDQDAVDPAIEDSVRSHLLQDPDKVAAGDFRVYESEAGCKN